MNSKLLIGITSAIALTMSSCLPPYNDPNIRQGNPDQQADENLTPEQLRAKQEEELRRQAQEEELRRQQAELTGGTSTTNPPITNANPEYPFANKVPGKEGFVFSPYNNKVVDVRGIPTGTLVADPTFSPAEKKYFRVP